MLRNARLTWAVSSDRSQSEHTLRTCDAAQLEAAQFLDRLARQATEGTREHKGVAELLAHLLKLCDLVHRRANDRDVEPSCRSYIAVSDFADVECQTELKALSVHTPFAESPSGQQRGRARMRQISLLGPWQDR